MKTNQTYTPEFRAEAAKLVLEQRLSKQEEAQKLGIPKGALANWVVDAKRRGHNRVQSGESTVEELKAEVARLRKDLARAKMEREILKIMNHRPVSLLALLGACMPLTAHAYVDPGTGMLVWQGLIAAFGAVLIFVRNPVAALKRLLERLRRK